MLKSFFRLFTRKKTLHGSGYQKTRREQQHGGKSRTVFYEKINTTKNMNCSPMVQRSKLNDSCYTPNILKIIRDEYNKTHSDSPIKSDDSREIWNELREKVRCEKEDCWLNQIHDTTLRKQIDRYVFAPDKPPEWKKNKNAWLSNYDILNVLEQYESTHKEFEFLGPAPIDFDTKIEHNSCVTQEVCDFNLKSFLEKGKTQIGIIFNIDDHTGPGLHWVSLYIDTKDRFIFYFDSNGEKIPHQILALAKRIQKQAEELNMSLDYRDNEGVIHQNTNTECGMYSLFFIITMLTGRTHRKKNMTKQMKWRLFLNKKIPDKQVEQYRDVYFNV